MDIKIEKIIGNNIKKLRIAKKMTQEDLATRLQLNGSDITRSALAKIEVGQRHIYVDEIIHLKEILNISFEELLEI